MSKKIIILLLSFFVSVTYIIPTYANTDKAFLNNDEYVFSKGTINTLGVTFVTKDEQSFVTRGEFVKALAALSGMTNISAKDIPYTDVTSDSPYYDSIKSAYSLSWISEGNTFNPEQDITLIQAMKIGIHAIGGEYQAAYYGGYPTGYVYLANSLDLNENLAYSDDQSLTVRDAYVLLYNIVSSKTFETSFEGDGNVSISFGASSILERQHDMHVYEGILSANSVTNLYDELETDINNLKVGSEEFIDEKGILDYLGCNVKVLYHKDGIRKYAKFVTPVENSIVTLNNHSIIEHKANTVYFGGKADEEKNLVLDSGFIYVFNGKTTLLTTTDLNSILKDETSVFTFIDNDSDNKYDILSVCKYTYSFVGKFDLYDGFIYDSHSSASLIDISAEGCKYSVRAYEDGVFKSASIYDIESGIVVAAAISADKTYVDIVLCYDTVSGVISSQNSDGTVEVDGVSYRLSDYYIINYTYKVGEDVNLHLGLNGEIVAETGGKSKMKYAFIIDSSIGQGLDKEVLLKLFDQSGSVLVLGIADKVKKDSVQLSASDIYTFTQGLTADREKFIRYSVNDNGKINCIDTYENKIDNVDSYGVDNPDDNALSLHFEGNYLPRGSKIFADDAGLSKFNYLNTDYIFVLPTAEERSNEELYRIADPSEIKTNSASYKLDLICYDADLSGSPKAMMVVGGYLQSSDNIDLLSGYGVVEKITCAIDTEGENVYKIYICETGGYKTIYLSEETANKYFVPNPGDIIGYSAKGNSTISYMIKYFDFATYTIDGNFVSESGQHAITSGFVYSLYGGYMHYFPAEMQTPYIPVCPETINFSSIRNLNYAPSKTIYIDVVRSADGSTIKSVVVNPNPDTKLKDVKTSGKDNASYVVNKLSYNASQATFAYNIIYR